MLRRRPPLGGKKKKSWVGLHKPDSVPHRSEDLRVWSFVCRALRPSPAETGCDYYPEISLRRSGVAARRTLSPVLSCTAWGLSCLLPCGWSGELLPRHFTLTFPSRSRKRRYLFCDTFRCSGFRQKPPTLARGTLPCGVRTFLSSASHRSRTDERPLRPTRRDSSWGDVGDKEKVSGGNGTRSTAAANEPDAQSEEKQCKAPWFWHGDGQGPAHIEVRRIPEKAR